MGGVMTGIDEIDGIRLIEIPSNKPVQVTAIRHGDTVILKYDDHRMSIARRYKTENWAFPMSYSNWSWQHDFIDVLHRLKMISEATRDLVHRKVLERDKNRELKYDRENIDDLINKYGIKLTAAQRKKIK